MAYPPRLVFPGAIYHVTARGDNRELTFLDEEDYRKYVALIGRSKKQLQFKLHAYALMPNHVHLIVEPSESATISRIMQGMTIAYTKWFNKRHTRVGHVFQGRFHSRVIKQDAYLLVASRYVHRNPVRAKLVQHPAEYPWSSYRAYMGKTEHDELVDTKLVEELITSNSMIPNMGYRDFVEQAFRSEQRFFQSISDIETAFDI